MTLAPVRVVSANDGPQITVNTLVKSPTLVPRRILSMLDQQFIADLVLRNVGSIPSGVATYYESNPLFSDSGAEIVAEFGEIPVALNSVGAVHVAQTVKRALAVRISYEMQSRNAIDDVNLQMMQVSNTMIAAWDGVFMGALEAALPGSHTFAATAAWDASPTFSRADIATAIASITKEKRGFNPNALIISPTVIAAMMGNDDIWKLWQGNINDQNPVYTGKLPGKLWGLDVYSTYSTDDVSAYVVEAKTVGFIGDERPLQATPLYEVPQEEYFRSDTSRQSLVGIDQPLAIAKITGVLA